MHTISFQTFFVWPLLLIVHSWNSSPLQSNLLRLQCTCCTIPTTSGRPHGNPLVWACQWPSSQPLSSPQLSHNNNLSASKVSRLFCTSICRRFLKIHYVIAIHLMRWLTNFYDFSFKWTSTVPIGIHPTKAWLSQLGNFKNAIWHFRRMICNKILF